MNPRAAAPFLRAVHQIRSLLVVAVSAAAATTGAAQSVLGLARTAAGDPIAGARVTFWPTERTAAPWRTATERHPSVGRTDDQGRFRIPVDRGAGALIVEHPRDGAGLVVQCWTGIPVSVIVGEAGRVRSTRGTFTLHLRALGPHGTSTFVGTRRGEAIAVAPGSYVALVEADGRLAVRACRVEPGTTTALEAPPDDPPLLVGREDAGALSLPEWPNVALRADGAGVRLPAIDGQGLVRERLVNAEGGDAFAVHGYDGRAARVQLPPLEVAWREVALRDAATGQPLAGARLLSIQRIGEHLHVRSSSTSDPNGIARVLAPEELGRCSAIVWREGHAPKLLPQPLEDAIAVELEPALTLRVRVATPDPRAAEGATVTVLQAPIDLPRSELANERGEVVFDDLAPAPTRIRVDHPEHAPAVRDVDLAAEPLERAIIELEPGLELWGTVLADGAPAFGAVVELRDARGTAGSTTRIVAVAADGTFRMRGLADERFTLFAHREARGTTWSRRITGAHPGASPYEFVLHPEDPPLPGSR